MDVKTRKRLAMFVNDVWSIPQERECSEVVHEEVGWWEGIDQCACLCEGGGTWSVWIYQGQ